jgi:FKBP-type peptidyl-prolyl cis-trans isomerase SlyD
MKTVSKGHRIAIQYIMRVNGKDGEILEETTQEEPFSFVFGEDEVLESFEKGVEGLNVGEEFEIFIPNDKAYGPELEDLIVDFPKETFLVDDEIDEEAIAEGEVVPMEDEEGNEVLGVVVENSLNNVTIDFNHPLAGEDLYFSGTILEVE